MSENNISRKINISDFIAHCASPAYKKNYLKILHKKNILELQIFCHIWCFIRVPIAQCAIPIFRISHFGNWRKYAWTILRASKKSALHTFLGKFGLQISNISYLRHVGGTRNESKFRWDVNCCTLQCAVWSQISLGRDCTFAMHSVHCMCMKTFSLATHLSESCVKFHKSC